MPLSSGASPMTGRRRRSDIGVLTAIIARGQRVPPSAGPMINSATKQPILHRAVRWIASRSLSSGAHSRDPLARNDEWDWRAWASLTRPGIPDVEFSQPAGNDKIVVGEHQRPRDAIVE